MPLRISVLLAALALVLVLAPILPPVWAAEGPGTNTHPTLVPGQFELHPDFALSLFAKEPDVIDPVAVTFDDAGRMFVVEMRDYPYGFGPKRRPGGTVRLLEDTDFDGRADRSVLFATNLSYPTSIAPWQGGVIVTAPPEILYLKDTDSDGQADRREVLFTGFNLGVTDSNVNGLRWGLDNRLHGVNGGNDGSITSSRRPGPSVSLRGLDFSFDPVSGELAPTFHTSGGFGLVFDDWGRSFVTYNINHLQQRIIPVRYLRRHPGLPPVEAVASISDHEDMAQIFPLSDPATRPNHPEQSGRFSAAGGMGYAGLRGLPGDVSGAIWVCDVVGNLVHRDVLSEEGPIFRARRSPVEQTNEFLSARDRSFRPVSCELGPDGAFYIADMQREVIEHPDYIPANVQAGLNLRAGEDRGRIYRLRPKNASDSISARPRWAHAHSSIELVTRLADPNQWWRLTAQRLLIERRATDVSMALRQLARGSNALGRLHALWTLNGLGRLEPADMLAALTDPHPGVRENAVVLSEPFLAKATRVATAVAQLSGDSSARVRFQAALTLGGITTSQSRAALAEILRRDVEHRWTRFAVLCSLGSGEADLLLALLAEAKANRAQAMPRVDAARELAELCGARAGGSANSLGRILQSAQSATERTREQAWLLAILDGLTAGLNRVGATISAPRDPATTNALNQLLRDDSSAVQTAAWRLANALGQPAGEAQRAALERARRRVADRAVSVSERVESIGLLGLGTDADSADVLFTLLAGTEPPDVQTAAITALRRLAEPAVARRLLEQWRELGPSARPQVLGLLLQRVAFHEALIEALESGRLTLGELNLDLEQRRRLLRRSSPALMTRAAKLMNDDDYGHRKKVVADWIGKLPAEGDPAIGQAIFARLCASCHAIGGSGPNVGPDLAGIVHRSVDDIISNILDPNMAINPAYVTYTAETADGEFESGILQAETPEAIVLLQAQGRRLVLPRAKIRSLRSSGVSLMPEGLEAGLTPADLRNLVSFLQRR